MVLPNVAPYKVFRKSVGERSLMVAVKNIARRLGDDISESKPIFDSRLPDGSRVAAVIPPCSLGGVTLTIRKFNTRHFNMEDLIREGTLDRALANHLEDYVLARKNVLICGGTGTGKSTLLSILGKFIPQDERVLVIEDTAELQLPQQNLVRFEARREQNGLPAVAIRDLLKAALRHRPEGNRHSGQLLVQHIDCPWQERCFIEAPECLHGFWCVFVEALQLSKAFHVEHRRHLLHQSNLIFYCATSDSKAGRKYQELWKPYHHFAPHQTRFDTLPEKSKCRILENHRDYFDKGRITQLSPRALSLRHALGR